MAGGEAGAPTGTIEVAAGQQDKEQQQRIAQELIERARRECVDLVGPNGLLAGLTKQGAGDGVGGRAVWHVGP